MSYCKKERKIIMKPKKVKPMGGIFLKLRKPSCCPTSSGNVNQIENNPVNTLYPIIRRPWLRSGPTVLGFSEILLGFEPLIIVLSEYGKDRHSARSI